jgi:hypothetical protein
MPIGAALSWDDDHCEVTIVSAERTPIYLVDRIRGGRLKRRQARVGAPDRALTPNAGWPRSPGGRDIRADLGGVNLVHENLLHRIDRRCPRPVDTWFCIATRLADRPSACPQNSGHDAYLADPDNLFILPYELKG